ncbi:hypothetical protein HZH66_002003 [Vespula vulgaris]|uniref:Uncharacterized protein n=1 Tax=Vespula vulgaris TaxID=7454 RepID=A0A834KIL8_VESVU|nr:hypothetical protein HZH66_002003 [Vespula vulgaris]
MKNEPSDLSLSKDGKEVYLDNLQLIKTIGKTVRSCQGERRKRKQVFYPLESIVPTASSWMEFKSGWVYSLEPMIQCKKKVKKTGSLVVFLINSSEISIA